MGSIISVSVISRLITDLRHENSKYIHNATYKLIHSRIDFATDAVFWARIYWLYSYLFDQCLFLTNLFLDVFALEHESKVFGILVYLDRFHFVEIIISYLNVVKMSIIKDYKYPVEIEMSKANIIFQYTHTHNM